jgi:hypothetical protein
VEAPSDKSQDAERIETLRKRILGNPNPEPDGESVGVRGPRGGPADPRAELSPGDQATVQAAPQPSYDARLMWIAQEGKVPKDQADNVNYFSIPIISTAD